MTVVIDHEHGTELTHGPIENLSELNVRIAHWHVNAWGGAEYLVTKLAEALGESMVYTIGEPSPSKPNPYGDVEFHDVTADTSSVITGLVKRRLGRAGEYSLWEDVDWREYGEPDVLISSGATTRAVITPDTTLHIHYCHSPPRWFYDLYHDRKRSALGRFARPVIRYLRTRDATIDTRVDHYLANSPVISRRLWKFYKREAEVLYPPVALGDYENRNDEGYYLHLGRLDTEKGVEEIVSAFETLDQEIVFVGGDGDASVRDRIAAAENMEYAGFVSEDRKFQHLSDCRAVVFNGRNEDFGIVPIEANASGKACLARNEGFPGLYIREGENGYVHDGTAESIRETVRRFESRGLDTDPASFVDEFTLCQFTDRLRSLILESYNRFRTRFAMD